MSTMAAETADRGVVGCRFRGGRAGVVVVGRGRAVVGGARGGTGPAAVGGLGRPVDRRAGAAEPARQVPDALHGGVAGRTVEPVAARGSGAGAARPVAGSASHGHW